MATSDQSDADTADAADCSGIAATIAAGIDTEAGSGPGVRWVSDLELGDGDGHGRQQHFPILLLREIERHVERVAVGDVGFQYRRVVPIRDIVE